jgi:hypothetical protein
LVDGIAQDSLDDLALMDASLPSCDIREPYGAVLRAQPEEAYAAVRSRTSHMKPF